MLPLNKGGDSWRVFGQDTEGKDLAVGVELVEEDRESFVIILTAFIKEKVQ